MTTITSIAGSAWGVSNTILVPIAPTPVVSIPPPPCPTLEQDDTATVIQLGTISVGLIHAETECQPALPSTNGFVRSSADVANVTIASVLPLLPPILELGAIHADCRSGRLPDGSIGSTGNATVASLTVGGQTIPVAGLGRNTVIDLSLIGIQLILNETVEVNTPTSTSISVNAVHLIIGNPGLLAPLLGVLPGNLSGELILGHVECSAQFQQVQVTTTTTTAPPATTTTTAAPATTTTTAAPATTTTTAAPATTTTTAAPATTTTTRPPATTSSTAPPTGTSAPTTSTSAPAATTTTTAPPGVLVRTGSNLQPLAMLSALSIVLGILMLIGSGRPLTANASSASVSTGIYDGPEKWGPVEIAKTIWAGVAALVLALVNVFKRDGGRGGG